MAHDSNRPNKPGNGGQGTPHRTAGKTANQQALRTPSGDARFENPYNFIPTSPRKAKNTPLGDAPPAGHHGYHPTLWSGRLRVELTTVTPLLIPDQAREARDGHKTYGLRLDAAGVPYLPPTSLKGALRSAYEAVTNSRMGVLEKHEERLGMRHPAQSGASVVPVRVTDDGEFLEMLPGFSEIGADGNPKKEFAQCAAWVPMRLLDRDPKLKHGQRVWACLQQFQHSRQGKPDFKFWRALSIQPDAEKAPPLTIAPQEAMPPRAGAKTHSTPLGPSLKWQRGWLVINGKNMNGKHDERLFFIAPSAKAQKFRVSPTLKDQWKRLIDDYSNANKRELDKGARKPSALSEGCVFSRQISTKPVVELKPGTLCYAQLRQLRDSGFSVEKLFPVLISRDLYATAPADLLDAALKPATDIQHLSPADRVFGWVKDGGHGQHKGQLRIGAVACVQGKEAIERVGGEQGVPLAILGAPKPAQARFYAATSAKGEPYKPGEPKPAMYKSGQGLRGRKVYLHDKRVADPTKSAPYWKAQDPRTPVKLDNKPVALEWLHASGERSDQNRSVTAWVKPGSTFRFDIEVTNLAEAELGALLWLLTQDDTHHFRLGGGKPLGFGVTRLKLAGVDLRDGQALAADYRNLGARAQEGARIEAIEGTRALIDAYKNALPAALGEPQQPFDTLKVIRAYSHAARGSDLAVHYPRTTEDTSGKVFEWFTNNEKIEKNSLPALHEANRGLAYTLKTQR